jgi:multidrug efflux system outer membrane protein
MKRSILTAAVLAAMLSGCASWFSPDFQRPQGAVPAAWPTGPAYGAQQASASRAADIGWRDFIVDARLRQLTEMALSNNRDLRIAALNIEKARAQYGIASSDLFPSISATAEGASVKTAQDLTAAGTPRLTHSYSAGVGFSAYELDFFGRLQNLKSAALETYLQTEEARNSAQISLIAEVASAYLTLTADQQQLKLAQDTLQSQMTSFDLIHRRFDLGIGSQLDVSQAQTSVDSARIEVASYTTQVAQDRNALAVLVGAPVPDALMPSGPVDGGIVMSNVPAGLTSDVLLQRPDLLADEHVLKASNADIGAARAAFFPSITLTASVGSGSTDLGRLFKGGNGTWSFIPQLNLPIFNAGQLSAELDVAKVSRNIAIAQYEKDIQTAFREVSDALALSGTVDQQVEAQQSLTNATAQSYTLANARYQNGIDGFLDVLDAQRTLFAAQQKLITVKLAQQTNRVTLYKALGGGVR